MTTYQHDDDSVVVIIGSGAGGGTLANELCQKGVPVVLLEAGKRESPATFINDEWPSFSQLSWNDTRTTSGSWRIARDFPNLPAWICKTVGGTTTHWAGASLRLQEHEFRARDTYGEIADADLLDWPIGLEDLEPYYARAEARMGVTRTNDIPGLPGNNFKVMYAGAQKLGYQHCSTGRMAINSRPRDGRAGCQQLGFCFQGCKMGAKWSTLYTEIPAAEATGKLELRAQSQAIRIEHDARGRPARWFMPMPMGSCSARVRASSRWRVMPSRHRDCCSTPIPACSRMAWAMAQAWSASTICVTLPVRCSPSSRSPCISIAAL